jgi:hypothetical protein
MPAVKQFLKSAHPRLLRFSLASTIVQEPSERRQAPDCSGGILLRQSLNIGCSLVRSALRPTLTRCGTFRHKQPYFAVSVYSWSWMCAGVCWGHWFWIFTAIAVAESAVPTGWPVFVVVSVPSPLE